MRIRMLICALLLLAFRCGVASDANNPGSPVAIVFLHANVIPMDREQVVEDQTVVIEGGRIV